MMMSAGLKCGGVDHFPDYCENQATMFSCAAQTLFAESTDRLYFSDISKRYNVCFWKHNYLSKLPVKLHPFDFGITAFNQSGSAVHIHQASVVIIINGGTQHPHMDLLVTCIVNILEEDNRGYIQALKCTAGFFYQKLSARFSTWTRMVFHKPFFILQKLPILRSNAISKNSSPIWTLLHYVNCNIFSERVWDPAPLVLCPVSMQIA